jgi:oligopeptidase B
MPEPSPRTDSPSPDVASPSGYLERKGIAVGIARAGASGAPAGAGPSLAAPPIAEPRPTTRVFGGIRIDDPYAWLERPGDPATIAYLEAENAYREAVMAPTRGLQERLYEEMLGRIEQTDRSVPVELDGWRYATRTEEGKQYPILVRSRAEGDPEQTLLDLNAMERTGYIRLGWWRPSLDGRLLAYLLNESGGIEQTLFVKDLERDEVLPDAIPLVASFAWASDGRTLFYVRQDDALRAAELYRHRLGTDPAADPLLYREDDPVFSLWLDATKDRRYLTMGSWSSESSEIRSLPADQPDGDWSLFAPRRPGILYSLEHLGAEFLVLTNEEARDFRLVAAQVTDPTVRRELVPHRPGRLLEGIDVFARHLVLYGREEGLTQVWIRDHDGGEPRRVEFAEPVHAVRGEWNPAFDAAAVRVAYSSFVTPPTVYDVDLETGERTLRKQDRIPSGHDPDAYVVERLAAPVADGVAVPISLVRRRDAPAGPLPTLLYGYGSYGYSTEPAFDPKRLSLLDRGMAFAIAHVRGGQELGRGWYDDGKLLAKTNTFADFVACADFLVAEGRAARDGLVFAGGSAGGLLMGAVVNLRPDLPRAVVAWVPFVDVLRVMADPSLPLTAGEFVEWGNPADPDFRDAIAAYSPYDHVAAAAYPAMLITGGITDDQVPYWQPAKWTAKLRAANAGDRDVLLRMNMGAGHGGASGRYDLLREVAHDFAFVLRAVGLEYAEPAPLPMSFGEATNTTALGTGGI